MRLVIILASGSEVGYDVHERMRFRVEVDGAVRILERGRLGLWRTRIYHPAADRWSSIRVERV